MGREDKCLNFFGYLMRSGSAFDLFCQFTSVASGALMIGASSVASFMYCGIVHVLRTGTPWRQVPKAYGPGRTLYNRFRRWAAKGIWEEMFAALADPALPDRVIIDSTIVRAHRCASGGKGGRKANALDAPAAGAPPRSIS